jgi:hypothetical protein
VFRAVINADSKCHSGVIDPGEGRTHRACAIRWFGGGIPPVLRARDDDDLLILYAEPSGIVRR